MKTHEQIAQSIRQFHEEWGLEHQHWLRHSNGLAIWIGNGAPFCQPATRCGDEMPTGIWNRCKLWRAYKFWLRWNISKKAEDLWKDEP